MGVRPYAVYSAASAPSTPARPLSRFITIAGDSRTANCHSGTAPNENAENYGYATWLCQYTGGRVKIAKSRNGGVGGDTTAMWLARMSTIIGYGSDVIINLISTNDRGAGLSLEISKRNIEAGIRMQLDAGKIPVIIAETPRGGANALTGTNLANHLALRDWIKSYFPTLGVRVADPWVDLIDPNNAAAGLPIDGYMHDGLHPGPIGARIIGKCVAAVIQDLFPAPLPLPVYECPYDATNAVTGSLNSNALCTGTTGTIASSANATGTVATGWSLVGSAWTGATAVASKEANPNAGEFQVLTVGGTPTAANSYVSFEQGITVSNTKSGDVLKAIAMVSHEGLVGVSGVSLDIRVVRTAGTVYVKYADRYLETTPMDGEKVLGPQETPVITLDGTETDIKVRLLVYGCQNVAMAGTIKVGQIVLRKSLTGQ